MTIEIIAETGAAMSALQKASELLAELPDLPLELRNRFLQLLSSGLEFGEIDFKAALETGVGRVQINLPNGFDDFVSAVRAHTGNRFILDQIGHGPEYARTQRRATS